MTINTKDFVFNNEAFQAHFLDTVSVEINEMLEDTPSQDKMNGFFIKRVAPLVKAFDLKKDDMIALGKLRARVMAAVPTEPRQAAAVKTAPVGLRNNVSHNDCWLNALTQIVMMARSLNASHPLFALLSTPYNEAQENGWTATTLNAPALRDALEIEHDVQADAAEALSNLLTKMGFAYQTTGESIDPVINLGLSGRNNLETLLNDKKIKFTKLPEDLFLHAERTFFDKRTKRVKKNRENIEVPQHLKRLEDPQSAYEIAGCIIHTEHGEDTHYISIKKMDGQWYSINDSIVTMISNDAAKRTLARGSVFYYRKVAAAPSIQKPEKVVPAPKSKPAESDGTISWIAHAIMNVFESFFAFFLGSSKKTA